MKASALVIITGLSFGMMSCASLRKLSHVETREPASTQPEAPALSPLRQKVAAFSRFAKACPAEIRELLAPLSLEKVRFPPCPARLEADFNLAREALTQQERNSVEELLGAQCRSLDTTYGGSPLDSLIEGIVPRPARGGRNSEVEALVPSDAELHLRMKLQESLLEVRSLHSPLEQWIRGNGDYLIPEDELGFVEKLAVEGGCRMSDQEVDQSYRTIHNLEALARIQPPTEPQRRRIERFLGGVHRVIDRKIQEYFQR